MADTALPPSLPPKPEDLRQAYVPVADFVEGNHPTKNPDGVTISNHDYTPKTQEEKAAMIRVPFVETNEVEVTEPYPEGNGWAETYDENFYAAHGYRREGKQPPPENKPEPMPEQVPEPKEEEEDGTAV